MPKITLDSENGICELCNHKDSHRKECSREGFCNRCGYTKGHSIHCLLATKEEIIQYCELLLKEIKRKDKQYFDWKKKNQEQLVLWEGKYRIVKQENNKFRKKFYPNK